MKKEKNLIKPISVIRGFLLPKRGKENKPLYSRIIDEEKSIEMYNDYKNIITNLLDEYTNNKKNKINNIKELNYFLNYFILKIKSLLYLDPIPNIISPALVAEYYLKLIENQKIPPVYTLDGIRKYSEYLYNEYSKIASKNENLRKKLFEILDFPADTRIAANTSSLIIHMLTVSGIAVASFLQKRENLNERELTILRLTSLFHDLGKFINWPKHEEVSSKEIIEIFNNYVESEAKKVIEDASKVINLKKQKKEQKFKHLYDFFKRSDILASRIDRLKSLLERFIEEEKEGNILKSFIKEYGKETLEDVYSDPEFWKTIDLEKRKNLTESFCKKINKIIQKEKIEKDILIEDIYLVKFDLRSIQSYISSEILKILIAGSRIVDIITYFGIPYYLIKEGIPAECILYFGGGNVVVIIPKNIFSKIKEKIRKEIEEIFISIGYSKFYKDFRDINDELEKTLALDKISLQENYKDVNLNIYKICDACGKKIAIENKENRLICSSCKKKDDIGSYIHFMNRILQIEKDVDKSTERWVKISKDVPVYISGHKEEEIERIIEEYKSISLIRFDGNIAGHFIASSISITDAHDRSIRLDYATKSAVNQFINTIRTNYIYDNKDFERIILGIMYIGGDDGAILMPSCYSILFAIFLANEFYFNTGCKLTLSVAIISTKPKHPLMHLYYSCGELLDEIVKPNCRILAFEEINKIIEKPNSKFRGAIGFYSTDGGIVLKENLNWILKSLNEENISSQFESPYLVGEEDYSIIKLIRPLLNSWNLNNINLDNISNENTIKEIINKIKDEINEKENKFKEFRNAILESLHINIQSKSDVKIRLIYIKRKTEENLETFKNIISNLIILNQENKKININLYDFLMLIKIMSGGKI